MGAGALAGAARLVYLSVLRNRSTVLPLLPMATAIGKCHLLWSVSHTSYS